MLFDGQSWKTINSPKLQAVNAQYLTRVITKEEASRQVSLIIESLYRSDGAEIERIVSNKVNEKLAERFIKEVTNTNRRLTDNSKKAEVGYINQVVRYLGELSITTADIKDITAKLDQRVPDNNKQRKLVGYVNRLMKFAKRHEKVDPPRKKRRPVKYLPISKWPEVKKRLPERKWQVLCQIAIDSGLRIGEIFALEPHSKLKRGYNVVNQVTRDGEISDPKWESVRSVAVFPESLKLHDDWMELKNQFSEVERQNASKVIKSACRRAIPNLTQHHISFQDLRHSYAKRLFENGVSLDFVAQNLGNSIRTCEEHYIGWTQTDVVMEATYNLITKN